MYPLGINEEDNAIKINTSSGLLPPKTSLNDMNTSWTGTPKGAILKLQRKKRFQSGNRKLIGWKRT